jgi:hypothetical protein
MLDMFVFRRLRQAASYCCSAEWGDMAMESILADGCRYDDANVYALVRGVILIANANADCCSIVRTLMTSGCWQSTVELESGSANGGGHARDCARESWPKLVEHRMKPCALAVSLYERALKPALCPLLPACVS